MCNIFRHWPDFTVGGLWPHHSTSTPPHFLCLSIVRNFWTLHVLFQFHLQFILCYLRGNSFAVPVFNNVFGPAAACTIVFGFPRPSLKTNGFPWADIFIPLGLLSPWHVHHMYSYYILILIKIPNILMKIVRIILLLNSISVVLNCP